MGKGLTKRITAIMAAVCVAVSSCLLCGCYRDRFYKYLVNYMDDIPVVCSGYRLVEFNSSEKTHDNIFFRGGSDKTTVELDNRQITVEYTFNDYIISYENKNVVISRDLLVDNSPEYITMTQMWKKYDDNMENYDAENYKHSQYEYWLCLYDNNIFIIDEGGGHGSLFFLYSVYGELPWTFYRFDIETNKIEYAGYFFEKCKMDPTLIIEKVENN